MEKIKLVNTPNTELMVNRHLVQVFTKELVNRGMDVTIAEGVSGGSLIDAITIPGSTRIIHIGGVFYSRNSKIHELGVRKSVIDQYGEYSPETAREMAVAMLNKSGASLSISSVGQIEPQNIHFPLYASIGYAMKGKIPQVKTILLPNQNRSRRLVKNEITQCAFSHALHFLRNDVGVFNQDESAFSYLSMSPSSQEIITVDIQAKQLISQLKERGMRLSTIESCTAGAIASAITDISGASQVYDMGWLAYDENVKARLGVPFPVMVNGNVYSLKVAREMAEAILKRSSSDVVIATTGTMETFDTRPFHSDTLPGTIYAAVIIRGHEPYLTKILIPCPLDKTREKVKFEATSAVLTFANDLLLEMTSTNKVDIDSQLAGTFLQDF